MQCLLLLFHIDNFYGLKQCISCIRTEYLFHLTLITEGLHVSWHLPDLPITLLILSLLHLHPADSCLDTGECDALFVPSLPASRKVWRVA